MKKIIDRFEIAVKCTDDIFSEHNESFLVFFFKNPPEIIFFA